MQIPLKYLFAVSIFLGFLACDSKTKVEKDIEAIEMDADIVRFDRAFAKATPDELLELRRDFPLFFPKQYHDSIWLQMMEDTLQIQLNDAVVEVFPESLDLEDDLILLFKHIKYYFPEFQSPKIYTATSDVDYRTQVIANDSLLILELDTFLGREHPFYEGIPIYIAQNMDPSQLIPKVAEVYAQYFVPKPMDRTLLAQMVFHGKVLYLLDLWLPETADQFKIGYSGDDIAWAETNEEDIWKYFIENELLYATQSKLQQRFIEPAPFSKFNLEIDNESPGRIGRWVGWQIVRSYMDTNPVSLQQMLNTPAEKLFNNSKYKPRR